MIREYAIRIGLDAALWGLSYLVPKKSGRIALGADLATAYKGNPKYLFEYLLDHPELGFDPVWITEDAKTVTELRKAGFPVLPKYGFRAFWTLLRAEFLVIDFIPLDVFYFGQTACGNFRFIQTAHGMPLKMGGQEFFEDGRVRKLPGKFSVFQPLLHWAQRHLMFNVFQANYELVPAQSEASKRDLERLYANDNVEVLGAPRNDAFFGESSESLRKELDLDQYERVLLYAPTWRDQFEEVIPFSKRFMVKLDAWLRERNACFLVKKHPLDKILVIGDEFENIRDLTGVIDDVQELAVLADVLITDYSSIIFDYCLTERPIIFYSYDLDLYLETCRGMIYDYYETLPGPFSKDEHQLFVALSSIDVWFHEPEYQAKYQAFIDRFNAHRDGSSSARVANYIKEKLQPRKRWKPNYISRLIRYRRGLAKR